MSVCILAIDDFRGTDGVGLPKYTSGNVVAPSHLVYHLTGLGSTPDLINALTEHVDPFSFVPLLNSLGGLRRWVFGRD